MIQIKSLNQCFNKGQDPMRHQALLSFWSWFLSGRSSSYDDWISIIKKCYFIVYDLFIKWAMVIKGNQFNHEAQYDIPCHEKCPLLFFLLFSLFGEGEGSPCHISNSGKSHATCHLSIHLPLRLSIYQV